MFDFLFDTDFLPMSESQVDDIDNDDVMTEEEDAMMEAYESIECPEDDLNEAMSRIMMETVENYHIIIETAMMDDFNEFISANEEVVYEESRVKNVIGAIKKFIENAWQKVKGVFEKFLNAIDTSVRSDAAFLKKNEERILKFSGSLEMKGYTYDGLKKNSDPYKAIQDAFESTMGSKVTSKLIKNDTVNKDSVKKSVDALPGKLRKAVLGSDVDSSDFSKKYKDYLLGSAEPVTIKPTPSDIVAEVKSAATTKNEAKKSYNEVKRTFKNLIKSTNDTEKVITSYMGKKEAKEADISVAITAYNKACRTTITFLQGVMKTHMAALSAYRRQCRAAASRMAGDVKAEDKKSKKDSVGESAFDLLSFI